MDAAELAGADEGYGQPGVVHGVIEILGEPAVTLTEVPAHRWHRWREAERAAREPLGPLHLPPAAAHTGVRAPFALPDGTALDLVLTSSGWARRLSR